MYLFLSVGQERSPVLKTKSSEVYLFAPGRGEVRVVLTAGLEEVYLQLYAKYDNITN